MSLVTQNKSLTFSMSLLVPKKTLGYLTIISRPLWDSSKTEMVTFNHRSFGLFQQFLLISTDFFIILPPALCH